MCKNFVTPLQAYPSQGSPAVHGRQTSRGSCRSGVTKFDTLWQYGKAGQTAPLFKLLAGWTDIKFCPNKLVCLIQFMSAEATPRKVDACLAKAVGPEKFRGIIGNR